MRVCGLTFLEIKEPKAVPTGSHQVFPFAHTCDELSEVYQHRVGLKRDEEAPMA